MIQTTGVQPMKKLCAGLLILLLAACVYLFQVSKKVSTLRETETQMLNENEKLTEQINAIQETISLKEKEITDLTLEKQPLLETKDVWEQRTEEIRKLLSE